MGLPNCYRCGKEITPRGECGCRDGICLVCGDCREVLPLLEAGCVDLVLTDPPYGISLKEHGRNGYDWTVAGDGDQAIGVWLLEWCEQHNLPKIFFASPMKPWPGKWRQHLVWDKGPTVGGGGDRKTCWKFSWDLVQVAGVPQLNGKRDEAVLRYHVTQKDYSLHPCQKPCELVSYLVVKATNDGGFVIDPFAGSGTAGKSCKDLGRRCLMIEKEDKYCRIASERLRQSILFN